MLRKLMKYDFMFSRTQFFVMAVTMIFAAALIRIFSLIDTGFTAAFMLVLVAIFVACIVLVYQNFNKNLFSGEGYLMLTLPVKRHKLITSKLIVSIIWFNFMLLAGVITALILTVRAGFNLNWLNLQNFLSIIFMMIYLNLFAINCVMFLFMLSTTANVSIRGRRVGGVLAGLFLALSITLESLFGTKVLSPLMGNSGLVFVNGSGFMVTGNMNMVPDGMMGISLEFAPVLTFVLFSVISYVVTLYFLKKRVDLQ